MLKFVQPPSPNFSTTKNNTNYTAICKKCVDLSIEVEKKESKVNILKKKQLELTNALKTERRASAKMQKEMDTLKTENEKLKVVRLSIL